MCDFKAKNYDFDETNRKRNHLNIHCQQRSPLTHTPQLLGNLVGKTCLALLLNVASGISSFADETIRTSRKLAAATSLAFFFQDSSCNTDYKPLLFTNLQAVLLQKNLPFTQNH